jgi:hypothetical protein
VGRDIRDVDPQAHAVSLALGRDRVVEVARGRRVHGEGGQLGQVMALEVRLACRDGGIAGLILERRGEASPHAAIPKERGDHVPGALGRAERAKWPGAPGTEVDEGDVTGADVHRAARQRRLWPALE